MCHLIVLISFFFLGIVFSFKASECPVFICTKLKLKKWKHSKDILRFFYFLAFWGLLWVYSFVTQTYRSRPRRCLSIVVSAPRKEIKYPIKTFFFFLILWVPLTSSLTDRKLWSTFSFHHSKSDFCFWSLTMSMSVFSRCYLEHKGY